MAKSIATDCVVIVNSVNLSAWAFKVDVKLEKSKEDVSGFNATASKSFLPGQADEEFIVSFRQDFANNAVDQTLWPLYNSGSGFAVSVQPNSTGGTATTNPLYSCATAYLYEYHPLDADLGNVSETTCTFACNAIVTRGTS
jgi:hypothetical protein